MYLQNIIPCNYLGGFEHTANTLRKKAAFSCNYHPECGLPKSLETIGIMRFSGLLWLKIPPAI